MKLLINILIIVSLIIAPELSQATGQSSARSVAMGGAFTALATGIDAYRYNPANLGLDSYRQNSLEIIGLGANINNNSFSLSDYNNYTGALLTSEDKEDILGKIPAEGLSLSADMEASAMGLSMGSMVFSVSGVGVADVALSKDIIDLVLNGNSFSDTISLTGSYSDAIGYISAGVSYGVPIYTIGTKQLAVGATFNYIRGLATEQITELDGFLATFETGYEGTGRMVARTATGGNGYSLDIGAALRFNDDYTVGVRIKNFLSSISWNSNTEEHGYYFSFDTMTIDNMNQDYIVSDDYSIEIPSFNTTLPSVMTVGLANTSGKLLWTVDWEQGFRRAAGATKKPRLSAGLEWTGLVSMLALRSGVSIGGNRPNAFSFGTGMQFSKLFLDMAVVTGGTFSPYSSKGVNFAISTGLNF